MILSFIFASLRSAPLKSVPEKSTFYKFALLSIAFLNFPPYNYAHFILISLNFIPSKDILEKFNKEIAFEAAISY